ncbi:MAG: glycoside hydrolase family 20 zincin-like fold domain-containing protein [Sedimentisphaerales bacterium]
MTIRDESYFAGLVVPVKKVRLGKGFFRLPDRREWGASLKTHRDASIGNPEGYRLNITQEEIEVFAKTDAGEYYAMQTLRDLIAGGEGNLPVCEVEDEPDFRRRGVYLDCSRGKVPKLETLKELATWLSHWKINEIQLYIENVFTFKKHSSIGKGYSPFTPDEILDFQEHCRRHHIRLVGSLASFGHLEKILTLPKYQHLGEMPGFRGFPGGTTLCPIDRGSIQLIEELYSEFVPLFDADDFNVCCDETWELGKGRSSEQAQRVGAGRVYLDFLLKIYGLCQKHGKRMNAWADIILKHQELLGELPRDIVLLNWEYEQDGANIARTGEIANAGLPVMVCPGTSSWLTHGTRLVNSMGNVTNFAAEGRKCNAEGLLNTDWGDNGHRNLLGVSLHGFAHAAANSWNGKAVDNAKFTENFCGSAFGQRDNRMAEAMRLLGSTYITCGQTIPNASLLFHSLFEPILHSTPPTRSPIDEMSESGLRQILAQLSDENIWPADLGSAGNFEQLALRELKLAARLDCLACERTLAAKGLRAGQNVKKSQLQRLSEQMRDAGRDFEELWLARNKFSRLYDNLLLFHGAEMELSKLAGQ